MTNERRQELRERYLQAAHAMQTGVALQIAHDPKVGAPKDLRVGINSAMSDAGALAKLLIDKGIFTEEEYYLAMAEAMEREAARYTKDSSRILGEPVFLK